MKNQNVKEWVKETKKVYNNFKNMPLKQLKPICQLAGMDMTHYTTRSLMAKGLIMALGSVTPIEMEKWN